MRLTLIGAISNQPDLAAVQQGFREIADALRALGHEVLDPTDYSDVDGRANLPWSSYMARSISRVLSACAVVALPGWADSRGGLADTFGALVTGRKVLGHEKLTPLAVNIKWVVQRMQEIYTDRPARKARKARRKSKREKGAA